MSASRFLRTTTRRSDEDVMETTPAARSTSDHPSRVEFIVKMAPQSPCSSNRRTMIPSSRSAKLGHNWADATFTPWSRPPRAPSPRPPCSTPTPTPPRSSSGPGPSTSWILSPVPSREVQGWAPVSSYSRSKQLRTGNNNNMFRSRRN